MLTPTQIRLNSRVDKSHMKSLVGKILTPADTDMELVGPTAVTLPGGRHLCTYLPGALSDLIEEHRTTLSSIRIPTRNRVRASGARSRRRGLITVGNSILSGTIGYMDGKKTGFTSSAECRTTAWTGDHVEEFAALYPLFQRVGDMAREYRPDEIAVQMAEVDRTPAKFVIQGTPFTSVTVNRDYPTGVHKDAGDLETGISCIAMFRQGDYEGGALCFPEFRMRVHMQDGDLMLMDAHQWHGNTPLVGFQPTPDGDCERIALVMYYRTTMVACPAS